MPTYREIKSNIKRLPFLYSIVEYGAINITGLRLVKTDSFYARDFLQHWRQLDRAKYQAIGNVKHSNSEISR